MYTILNLTSAIVIKINETIFDSPFKYYFKNYFIIILYNY